MKTILFSILLFVTGEKTYSQGVGVQPKANGARMQRIGNNVYAIIHDNATNQWPHGNTGVIIGNDAVMVVEACYLPSMAREDIRLVRSVTK